jgi:anti-sigma factor RsiW
MAAAEYSHSPSPEEIMEFLDGEGTAAGRTAIEAHLADCAACQVIASEQRHLSMEMSEWIVGAAPASVRPPRRSQRRPVLRFAVPTWLPSNRRVGGLAAAIVAIVAALAVVDHFRTAKHLETYAADAGPARSNSAAASSTTPAYDDSAVPERPPVMGDPRLMAQLEPRQPLAYSADMARQLPTAGDPAPQAASRKPSIVRTAKLRIVAKDFPTVQSTVEQAVTTAGGFIDRLTATSDAGLVRSLRGVVRIPADRLDTVTTRLRSLGQVLEDTQGSQDVTDQLVDLDARLRSARATERRLTDLLANRTAKLSDVLEVERELARVRIEIERLDAEHTNIGRRVTYAALTLEIMEERKAGLTPGPLSFASRFRVAAADGVEAAVESVAWTLLTVIEAGPVLLLWIVTTGSVWLILRRMWRSRIPNP